MKMCLSCMRKIPLLAGRCPYCRDDDQSTYGRIILLLIFIVGVFLLANYRTEIFGTNKTNSSEKQYRIKPSEKQCNQDCKMLLNELESLK